MVARNLLKTPKVENLTNIDNNWTTLIAKNTNEPGNQVNVTNKKEGQTSPSSVSLYLEIVQKIETKNEKMRNASLIYKITTCNRIRNRSEHNRTIN